MRAADGRVVWFHDEAQLIRGIDGAPVSWQGVMIDITERREAEQELQLARERLQALIEHIPAIVYRESDDEDPAKFFLSPQVERILGYTVDEWTWTDDFWADRLHPDDRERVLALDIESGRTHRPYSVEYRFRRADGAYVWVQEEASFLQPDPGEQGAWQGLLFDVTARKEAEEQLRASELVQSATVEHLPAIVYREPPDGPLSGTLYVSPQVREMLGYTPEEWTTSEVDFWAEHIHPEDAPSVLAANKHANATKEPFGAEYRIQHADGSYRWVHDEATFVSDVAGGWWQGFMIDISERRAAEDQLREAEERFRLIVERGPADLLPAGVRPRGPRRVAHHVRVAAAGSAVRLLGRGAARGPDAVGLDDPPRRPRPRAVGRRREQPQRRRALLDGIPDDQQGRPDPVGAGHLLARAGPREAAVLAGVHPRHHRAQAGRGTARARPGGRARGDAGGCVPSTR